MVSMWIVYGIVKPSGFFSFHRLPHDEISYIYYVSEFAISRLALEHLTAVQSLHTGCQPVPARLVLNRFAR